MSIAPPLKKDENFDPKIATRISFATKETAKKFFTDPAYYIFWIMFVCIVIFLFTGRHVSIEIYGLIIFIGIFNLVKLYLKK